MIQDARSFVEEEAEIAVRTLGELSKRDPPAYPLGQINPKPLKACRGLFFYHTEKVGLGLGVKWGRGWLLMRTGLDPPKWSPPVFYKILEGSIGFTAGKGGSATVVALGTDDAVDSFVNGHPALGSDLNISLGSGSHEAESNNAFDKTWKESRAWTLGTDGILADVSLTGGRMMVHTEANHALYGPSATPTTIIVAGDASTAAAAGFQGVYDILARIISSADSDSRKFSGFQKHWSPQNTTSARAAPTDEHSQLSLELSLELCSRAAVLRSSGTERHLEAGCAAPRTADNPRDSLDDRLPQPAGGKDNAAAGQKADEEETKGLLSWGSKAHPHQA